MDQESPTLSYYTQKRQVANPRKKDVFEIYCFWRSFPFEFFKIKPVMLEKDGYDIDALFERLLRCKNLSAFSKEFNVSKDTLADWERSEVIQKKINELASQNNVLRFRKDIDRVFTKKILKYPDVPSVKLWHQMFAGFVGGTRIVTDIEKKKKAKEIFDRHI